MEIKKLEWVYKAGLDGDVISYGVADEKYEILTMETDKAIYLRIYNANSLKPKCGYSFATLDEAKEEAQTDFQEQVMQYLNVPERVEK